MVRDGYAPYDALQRLRSASTTQAEKVMERKTDTSLEEVSVLLNAGSGFFESSRGGTRTPDPVINSHLLYHLSYSGIEGAI